MNEGREVGREERGRKKKDGGWWEGRIEERKK